MQKKAFILGLIVLIVLGITTGIYLWQSKTAPPKGNETTKDNDAEILSIVADAETSGLIDLTAHFEIETTPTMTVEVLKEKLLVDPVVPLAIEKKAEGKFSVIPEQTLPRHALIRFSFPNTERLSGWAFQTVDVFRIKSTYPANESINVDVKTGIEIDFTQPVEADIRDHISLMPAVDFDLQIKGTKVIILPVALEKDVLYRVTIKKGYTVASNESLVKDYLFSFSTGEVNAYTNINTMSIEVLTPEMTKRLASSFYNESPIDLKLYAFEDGKKYKSLIDTYLDKARFYKNPGKELNIETLVPVLEDKVTPILEDYAPYIYLPEDLGKGYYLALTQDEFTTTYSFFQITDFALYAEASDAHVLFFGIDTATQNVLTNAVVRSKGETIGNFNTDGVALVDGFATEEYYLVETKDESVLFPLKNDYYGPWYNNGSFPSQSRQVFLYTDRPTYKPNDELSLYGILNPEKGETLTDVRIEVEHGWMSMGSLFSQTFKLDDYHSLLGTIPLDGYETGYYQIKAYHGDVLIGIESFSVEAYELPEFKVEQTLDKEVIINGEEVTARGMVSYFDGTPLKDYALSAQVGSMYTYEKVQSLKTDSDGRYEWTTSPVVSYDTWRPVHYGLKTGNQAAENIEISQQSFVYLFPSDRILRGTGSVEGTLGHVTIDTHVLNVPERADAFGEDYDLLKGQLLQVPVDVIIKETYYEKVSQGEIYDTIRKKNVEKFAYVYRENVILDSAVQTVNGTADVTFETVSGRFYIAELITVDGYGKRLKETVYLNQGTNNPTGSEKAYFDTYLMPLTIGDPIEVPLVIPASADQQHDKALFLTYQNKFLDYTVTSDPVYKSTFTKADIPNRILKVIYYDGTQFNFSSYQNICSLQLAESEKQLEVQINASDEIYKPGQEATFEIRTAVSGTPVAAQVVVNVVDEAYYAAFEDYNDIRRELYTVNFTTGIVKQYYPGYLTFNNMAEGGEGDAGAGPIRSEFKDTAAFMKVQTNKDGVGTVTVKLPDNLTTWRVTAHGVTKDLDAGMGKGKLRVSIPFFVRVLKSPTYLVSETPSLILRADGEAIDPQGTVKYTVSVTHPDGSVKSQTVTGSPYDFVPLALGQLLPGTYSYTVSGEQGALKDALAGSFEVVTSRVSFDAFRELTPTLDFTLKNPDASSQLTFWNTAAMDYMTLLDPILNGQSDRIEWIIAEAEADALMFKGQADSWYALNALNLLPLYKDYGGLKPLKSAEADLLTTVHVVSLSTEYLSKGSALDYFYSALKNPEVTRMDSLLALWGLALYDEPVLNALRTVDPEMLKPEEKIIYGLALSEIGDLEKAYTLYKTFDPEQATTLNTESLYGLANLGANFAGESSSELWFKKALAVTPEEHVHQLQQVQFLKHLKNKLPTVTVKALVNGEAKSWTLDTHASQTFLLKPGDSFTFTEISGAVTLQENFTGTLTNVENLKNDQIQVKRTVSNDHPILSEIVKVSIALSYPKDVYLRLQDTVPSGFAPLGEAFRTTGYPQLFFAGGDRRSETITYELRAKQVGDFVLEPLVVTMDGSSFILTEPIKLQVTSE